jgi:hypothetical protein
MEQELEIERSETGIRVLFTLLFILVIHAIEVVLGVVVFFGLVFALITRTEPPRQVRDFADRVIRYTVEVVSYLTYNRDSAPFPFDDFPPARGEAPPSLQVRARRAPSASSAPASRARARPEAAGTAAGAKGVSSL